MNKNSNWIRAVAGLFFLAGALYKRYRISTKTSLVFRQERHSNSKSAMLCSCNKKTDSKKSGWCHTDNGPGRLSLQKRKKHNRVFSVKVQTLLSTSGMLDDVF